MNIKWIEFVKCLNWVHYLCEGTFSQGTSLSNDADFQCVPCWWCNTEKSIRYYFVAKSNKNSEGQHKLALDTAELKSQCEALKYSFELNIGDYECQLLETQDRIKFVYQSYDLNVIIGNHFKIKLNNYEKLCDVVSNKPEFHEHISECFCIYSELNNLISATRFLTETETNTVKSLQMRFENFNKYFPNEVIFWKIHELIFDIHHFLPSTKHWDTLVRRNVSVHQSINR